jgi:putative intracellular protease/amidase
VPVQAGARYALSLFLRVPDGSSPANATVALLPGGSAPAHTLANATFGGLTAQWQRFEAELVAGVADANASLAVSCRSGARLC